MFFVCFFSCVCVFFFLFVLVLFCAFVVPCVVSFCAVLCLAMPYRVLLRLTAVPYCALPCLTVRSVVRRSFVGRQGGWKASRLIVASFDQFDLLEVNAFLRAYPELSGIATAAIMDSVPISLARETEAIGASWVSVGKVCAV